MADTEYKYKNPYGSTKGKFQQTFDMNETVKMAGKEINCYERIQEAREDTEIYPTLEKYGCLEKIPMDVNKTFNDFTEFKDLRTLKDQQIKANQMWLDLPWEIRAHFDNNINEFIEHGENYVADLIKQAQQQEQEAEQPKEQVNE